MQNQSGYPQGLPIEQIMRLADTPQGKALLSQLQQQHPQELENAIAQAQAGNYEQVKRTISDYLSSPEGKELMKKLRGR